MTGFIVLDASAALEAVLRRPEGRAVLDALESADEVLAPGLFASEVGNALWKHARAGDITGDECHRFLGSSLGLVDRLIPDHDLISEALSISVAFGHPVYDVLYAVAAQRHGAAVCTFDRRLGGLLREMRVALVEV